MKSIFETDTNKELLVRIKKLNPKSKPLWGKMDASQMLAHSQAPFDVAFGYLKVKRGILGFLFGGYLRKKLTKDLPFGKNLPTIPEFKKDTPSSFEIEQLKLIKLVQHVGEKGFSAIKIDTHPFFGKMNSEEWDCLLYKHIDHHLKQFGV